MMLEKALTDNGEFWEAKYSAKDKIASYSLFDLLLFNNNQSMKNNNYLVSYKRSKTNQ